MGAFLWRIASAWALAVLLSGCGDGEKPESPTPPAALIKVFEYTPAPGQFINETPAYDGVTTCQAANAFAEKRMDTGLYVSLGGFGGYIVVGFEDGSGLGLAVPNNDGHDFSVTGNQMDSSSEPGVVWVMADGNGNGMPDEGLWYELAGSEAGAEGTVRDYQITYRRPADDGDVPWTDNRGNSGAVRRMDEFGHAQTSYYPAWIAGDELVLSGTLLETNTVQDGIWQNRPYGWGYADNLGGDHANGNRRKTFFDISNAIDSSGQGVALASIDFIKIQTAVNAYAGPLGEVSTEVCGLAIGGE